MKLSFFHSDFAALLLHLAGKRGSSGLWRPSKVPKLNTSDPWVAKFSLLADEYLAPWRPVDGATDGLGKGRGIISPRILKSLSMNPGGKGLPSRTLDIPEPLGGQVLAPCGRVPGAMEASGRGHGRPGQGQGHHLAAHPQVPLHEPGGKGLPLNPYISIRHTIEAYYCILKSVSWLVPVLQICPICAAVHVMLRAHGDWRGQPSTASGVPGALVPQPPLHLHRPDHPAGNRASELSSLTAELFVNTCDEPISLDSAVGDLRAGYPCSAEFRPGSIDILYPDPLDLSKGYCPTAPRRYAATSQMPAGL